MQKKVFHKIYSVTQDCLPNVLHVLFFDCTWCHSGHVVEKTIAKTSFGNLTIIMQNVSYIFLSIVLAPTWQSYHVIAINTTRIR